MDDYTPPVAGLLALGPIEQFAEWLDYPGLFGISGNCVGELLRMADDPRLLRAGEDTELVCAPVHAWRALAQLHAAPAVPVLLRILETESAGDYGFFEIPAILGVLGAPAIEPIMTFVASPKHEGWARAAALSSVRELVTKHGELRSECIDALLRLLTQRDRLSPALTALVVLRLAEVRAEEARTLINELFDRGLVDEATVTRERVERLMSAEDSA